MKKPFLISCLILLSGSAFAQLPQPEFVFDNATAIVITDPQNDFLHESGVAWGAVGENVIENKTRENLLELFKVAQAKGIKVFVSPHYYYPHDHTWGFAGVLETLMHQIGMFDRKGTHTMEGFVSSGADWLEMYKPFIEKENVTVVSPHKVFGPESNDLALQLRKQGIDKVVIAGMSGNLCVESHLRELLEEGFEAAVVWDATASAKLPGLDGAQAAMTNYQMLASRVFSTKEFLLELK